MLIVHKIIKKSCNKLGAFSVFKNESDESEPENDANENDDDGNENEANEDDNQGDEDEERKKSETELLYDEATMPIEEVLKRYNRVRTKAKRAMHKKLLKANGGKPIMPSPNISKRRPQQQEQHNEEQSNGNGCAVDGTVAKLKTNDEFKKQEEIDISEIKKNSVADATVGSATSTAAVNSSSASLTNHDQDYDEASNLVSTFAYSFGNK